MTGSERRARTSGSIARGAGLAAAALLALALGACNDRNADVPVYLRFPIEGIGTPWNEDVQSLRVSVRKGTPGSDDMKVLESKIYPAGAESLSFSIGNVRGGRDRFIVVEGLNVTPDEYRSGEIEIEVLARGSTVPADHLPGGAEPPPGGDYPALSLFVGRVGEMSAIARLNQPRAFFGVAPLDGRRFAVAGGINADGAAIANVEVFEDRPDFYFTFSGSMTSARAYPAAASIGDDGVLGAGGVAVVDTASAPVATAEILDGDGQPQGQALPLGLPRMHLAAVPVEGPNGEPQALIAGGTTSWDVTEAERQVERWDGAQVLPYQPMLIARAGLAAAPLLDGSALLVGGYSLQSFGTGTIAKVADTAELVDTRDPGSPYEVVDGMRPHWAATATTDAFGDVLIAGGASEPPGAGGRAVATTAGELFRPEFETFVELPPMAEARAHHAAAALPDGGVIVCGGVPEAGVRPGDGVEPLSSCEVLVVPDVPEIPTWEDGPTLLRPRFGHAMLALPDGSVLIVGGATEGGVVDPVQDYAEIYTPEWPEPE